MLNHHFKIKAWHEESKSEKLYEITAGCKRMHGCFEGEIDRFSLKFVIKNA